MSLRSIRATQLSSPERQRQENTATLCAAKRQSAARLLQLTPKTLSQAAAALGREPQRAAVAHRAEPAELRQQRQISPRHTGRRCDSGARSSRGTAGRTCGGLAVRREIGAERARNRSPRASPRRLRRSTRRGRPRTAHPRPRRPAARPDGRSRCGRSAAPRPSPSAADAAAAPRSRRPP